MNQQERPVSSPTQLKSLGQRLREQRLHRKISQESLAEMLGVSVRSIRRWEQDQAIPQEIAREHLCHFLGIDPQSLFGALSVEKASPVVPLLWQIPFPRNPFFTGRETILRQLHEVLGRQQTAVLSQSSTISGLGGIGKTQTALEYAYRYTTDYTAVFWIRAETIESLLSSFAAVADLLDLPEKQEQDQQRMVAAVTRWLTNQSGWLLIFDNVEDPEMIKNFLPPARQGAVLLTSRSQALGLTAQTLDLEHMEPEEGLRFLLHRSRRLNTTASPDQLAPEEKEIAQMLVAAMDGLPLALDQAGAYIERTGCSLAGYLDLFQHHQVRLLTEQLPTAAHPQSVVQTFLLSFEKVAQANMAAIDLLHLCAFLHPDAIPEELIWEGAPHWSSSLQEAAVDPLAFDQAIATLLRFSLVKRSAENKTLSLHRLVQAVLLDTLTRSDYEQGVQRVVAALDTAFPEVEPSAWNRCERLLPHALLCLQRTDASQETLGLASVASKAAQYVQERGRYAEAELLFKRTLHIREQALGPIHPLVATSLYNLARIYQEQGKYTEAEPLFKRALHICEEALGPAHPQIAYPLHGLGMLYREQGKYTEAEPLFQQALDIREQALGHAHPLVATSLTGLAVVCTEQGKYGKAEPLFQQALDIWEQSLGPTHPQTAYSLLGLAIVYQEQGQYAEAEPLFQQALDIWEQSLGPVHPRVASSLHNLAILYREQGKYTEAEPLFQRSLDIWEQTLGSDHPLVAHSLLDLAILYREQSKYTEAEPLFQRALSIREQVLEQQHPDTAIALHDFAIFREVQGRREEALALYQRALTIREQIFGLEHPKTRETRERLLPLLQTNHEAEESV